MSLRKHLVRAPLRERTLKEAQREFPGLFSEFSGEDGARRYGALRMRSGWSGNGYFCRGGKRDH